MEMKESPQSKHLEEILKLSNLVAGGFMGDDNRSVSEIIESDTARVEKLGYSLKQVAEKMRQITNKGIAALGSSVDFDEHLEVIVDEAKGQIVCPWPHPGRYDKRVTTVEDKNSGKVVRWSDLNIHLITEHGFFEGKGSAFRVEPEKLVKIIFDLK